MTADRFEICWPLVLAEECPFPQDWSNPRNFDNDPRDRGGATMCGIIQREYDHFRKVLGKHVQPVRLISKEEGHWIYLNWYWLPHCPHLPPGLDLAFFDAAVNQGSVEAIRILQVSLRLDSDGIWGPKTAAAIANTPVAAAVKAFALRRAQVYHLTRSFEDFGEGWLARNHKIEMAGLGMIDGATA